MNFLKFPFKVLLFCAVGLLSANQIAANETQRVTSIDIYVMPFYSAHGGKPEYVRVYDKIDELLMKNDAASLKKAIQIVETAPALVAPLTLMTIAARAYDLGLKNEAIFWFYNGKNRFITFHDVIDMNSPEFFETKSANLAFIKLAGDVINPYAFCDINKQRAMMQRSIEWIKANPY